MTLTIELESSKTAFLSDIDFWLIKYLSYNENRREEIKRDFANSLLVMPANKESVGEMAVKYFKLQPFECKNNGNYEFIRSSIRLDGNNVTITLGLDFDKLPFIYQGIVK